MEDFPEKLSGGVRLDFDMIGTFYKKYSNKPKVLELTTIDFVVVVEADLLNGSGRGKVALLTGDKKMSTAAKTLIGKLAFNLESDLMSFVKWIKE